VNRKELINKKVDKHAPFFRFTFFYFFFLRINGNSNNSNNKMPPLSWVLLHTQNVELNELRMLAAAAAIRRRQQRSGLVRPALL
jgi:hypothetical protein